MNFETIKKEVESMPENKLRQHGFYQTDITESTICFYGNKMSVWWAETVVPISKKAQSIGLNVQAYQDRLVIKK